MIGYKCDNCGSSAEWTNIRRDKIRRDKQLDEWQRKTGWLVSENYVLCPFCKAKSCYLLIQVGTKAIYLGNRKCNKQRPRIEIHIPRRRAKNGF